MPMCKILFFVDWPMRRQLGPWPEKLLKNDSFLKEIILGPKVITNKELF